MRNEAGRGGGGYLAGARAGLPFALIAGVVAISFGVLARSLGWGVLAPIVFSVITFSASAQFAVAAVLGAGGGVFAAIAAAVLLNARFLPMGVAVAPFLKGGPFCVGPWRARRSSIPPGLWRAGAEGASTGNS